jgi:hypothetical protein
MAIGGENEATWPTLDDLRVIANVPEGNDHDAMLASFLTAAIAETKATVGEWDELVDVPNDSLAASALMRAFELVSDVYVERGQRKSTDLLTGQRRRFSIG